MENRKLKFVATYAHNWNRSEEKREFFVYVQEHEAGRLTQEDFVEAGKAADEKAAEIFHPAYLAQLTRVSVKFVVGE